MSHVSVRSLIGKLSLAMLAAALLPTDSSAVWPHDANFGNVTVCSGSWTAWEPNSVTDGAGGTIIAWSDNRDGSPTRIYVQRLDAAGVARWTTNGMAVCTALGNQTVAKIVADGAGGAIIVWQELRSGTGIDIFVQKIDATGVAQWGTDGVTVCAALGNQFSTVIATDDSGGAIVAWRDERNVTTTWTDIYAQRIDASGSVQWTADGIVICSAPQDQDGPQIIADGSGGAIVAWRDNRNSSSSGYDIYAQSIDPMGAVRWAGNGVALCASVGAQENPAIVADGAGGAIVTWRDARSGPTSVDIYAQRVLATGVPWWTANGVAICTATGTQYDPQLVMDGSGGAIVAWFDARSDGDIFAQRIAASGSVYWSANGVAICNATGQQDSPRIVTDGSGGAMVTWQDSRVQFENDIFAQKVNGAGVTQWTSNGVALCSAFSTQQAPTIVADGAGGAIVAWEDWRISSAERAIFAQRVDRFGYLGAEPAIASVRDVPNDQGGKVKVAWRASWLDAASDANLAAYDVYRSAPGSLVKRAADQGARIVTSFAERTEPGERVFVVDTANSKLYAWEYLSSIPVTHFLDVYGYIAPTTGDSIADANPRTAFMVVGRNTSGTLFWPSQVDSGYSVDNLAPAPPIGFAGEYLDGVTNLHWNANTEPDLACYRIYRGGSEDFVPDSGSLIATIQQRIFADDGPAGSYYKLSAVDANGNESPRALLRPSATSAVPGAQTAEFYLYPNEPNPFNPRTTFKFSISKSGRILLAIYDVRGAQMAMLVDTDLPAGEQSAEWDGLDGRGNAAPSGVYFARLETPMGVRTVKITLAR